MEDWNFELRKRKDGYSTDTIAQATSLEEIREILEEMAP